MTYLPNGFDVTLLIVMFAFFAAEVQIFARLRARDPMNSAAPRMRTYAFFIVYQWLLVACTAALWIAEKRSWAVLLLGAPNAIGFAVGLALVVVYLALALIQRRAIFARPELLERMRPNIGDVEFLAPRTPNELRAWYVAAITAGCCEEVFYRGFILAFVGHFAGIAALQPCHAYCSACTMRITAGRA